MSLTNAEKRELKSRAQLLEPVVKLGLAGMSEGFLRVSTLRSHCMDS